MSDLGKAVFLSYAREDAYAARRIAETLRAHGVEVWFDESELRGGDSWDAKIRQQIKECALFMPMISASTQARAEGYFRVEWRLADRRTESIGKSKAFLVPVCIDDTREAHADVPDSFLSVQWTRLPAGETPRAFGERVRTLLHSDAGSRATSPTRSATYAQGDSSPQQNRAPAARSLRSVIAWALPVLFVGAVSIWQPWRNRAPKLPIAAPASPLSPTAAEVARLRARLIPHEWRKEDFEPWSAALDRIIAADDQNSDAWALRSIVNSLQVMRNYIADTKPLETGRTAANRALHLSPSSPLAQLAIGMHHAAMISRGGDVHAARPHLRSAFERLPLTPLTRYADLASAWLAFDFEEIERAAKVWLKDEPAARFPAFILGQTGLVLRDPAEAIKWAERAASDGDITGMRAFVVGFDAEYYLRADLVAARKMLDRIPTGARSAHRVMHARWLLAMAEGRWDTALQELARTPESIFYEGSYYGPKALLTALAHQAAGRPDAALAGFREAEAALREQLAGDPQNEALHAVLAATLAHAGRAEEARSELALVEPLARERPRTMYSGRVLVLLAQTHAALGQIEPLIHWLRKLLSGPAHTSFTPASLRIDPRFRSVMSRPEVQALLAEFAHLDAKAATTAIAAPTGAPDPKFIAVLPFETVSGADVGFADGMHDEILTAIAKVAALKVVGRTSVLPYRDSTKRNLKQIAADLGVGSVVEGVVRRSGNRVRVSVELVDTQTSKQLWRDSFEDELTDVFAIQTAVAKEIAATLRATFTAEERALLQRRPTESASAYELYLQAKLLYNDVANSSPLHEWQRVIDRLEQAVAADPKFAQAYALLSRTHANIYWYGSLDPSTARRELARATLALAQRLAPAAAETRFAEGRFAYTSNSDFEGAMRHYQAALVELPNDGALLFHTGLTHRQLGQHREAVTVIRRALELNPLDVAVAGDLMPSLLMLRRFSDAVTLGARYAGQSPEFASVVRFVETARFEVKADKAELVRRVRSLPRSAVDPHGLIPHYYASLFDGDLAAVARVLADVRLASVTSVGNTILEPVSLHRAMIARLRGEDQEAKRHAAEAEGLLRERSWTERQMPMAALALARAAGYAGRNEKAREQAAALRKRLGSKNGIDEISIINELGRLYAVIGAREEAIAVLRELMTGPNSPFYGTPRLVRLDPCWARLGDDPRFEEILKEAKPL